MDGFGGTELLVVLFGLLAPIVLIFLVIGILTLARRQAERYEEKSREQPDFQDNAPAADDAELRRKHAANEIDSTEYEERLRYHGRER